MQELRLNENVMVLHFGELWLRGRNRNRYISRLIKNINFLLKEESFSLAHYYDRLLLRFDENSNIENIKKKICYIFGISAYELATVGKPELSSIKKIFTKKLKEMGGKTQEVIKISSHRSFKGHTFNSLNVISELTKIAEKQGYNISNHSFSKEFSVNITKEYSFVYCERFKGAGGLPVGSSGVAVILLSGGIDSPVASWYAMKRGLQPIFIHIHAYPSNDEAYNTKIGELYRMLGRYSTKSKLYLFPSTLFQFSSFKLGRNTTVILKAFMLLLADKIAEREHSYLIYTGESLGQVSSQTPSNISAESYGIKKQILRPLIGMDKEEIIKISRYINAFDISTKPYKDVCSINSRNACTAIDLNEMKKLQKEIKIKKLVTKTLKLGTVII